MIQVAIFGADGNVAYLAGYETEADVPAGASIIAPWAGVPPSPNEGAELRFASGALYWHDARTLADVKAAKNTEINNWRMAANRAGFMFSSKRISTDELSRSDIDGCNGTVALTGEFPAGWPGAWKTDDNSYVAIPDVATWKLFYAAMSAQGAVNFATSQALKAQLAAATTAAEVDAIAWPT